MSQRKGEGFAQTLYVVGRQPQHKESKPMTDDSLELTEKQVLDYACSSLQAYLPLSAEGYKCSTEDLLHALLGVAAQGSTLESICADLNIADAETIRGYLNEQLTPESLPELERSLNASLAGEIPAYVWRRAHDIALDLHDRPYYGKQGQEEGLWVRGKARDGTTRFYRIATAYVMLNGLRMTLALHFYLPGDNPVTALAILLERVRELNIPVRRLFLDKGFGGIDCLEYLDQHHWPAIIACTIRGQTGGTRALCRGTKSYRSPYTFRNGRRTFPAELAVCRVFSSAKRTGRLERRASWQIFILIHLDLSPRQVRKLYRRRFGIESSYRCAAQVRGWTTSKNVAYRFVLMGLSFFLLNVWIHLRWLFTQIPRRGRRPLDTKQFRLARFARFIVRALEQHHGCVHSIRATVTPRL
jgi:putative transposase